MGFIISLVLGTIPAFIYALFVYWLDRYEKEPLALLGAAFAWGALIASAGAFFFNTLFGITVLLVTGSEAATEISTGSISAPLVEESLKGLAVLLVFLFFYKEFDNLLDGIVYASITALGFAATENAYYIYTYGFQESGMEGVMYLAFVRNILVGWQHPFYTSFIGLGLAMARLNKSWLVRIGAPLLGWMIAVAAHAVHNTLAVFVDGIGGLIFGTFIDWSGWLFMFAVVLWAISRERNFLKQYLYDEVGVTISADQYRTATSARAMTRARFGALGAGNYRETNRFYTLCTELSHKKRQVEKLGDEQGTAGVMMAIRGELAGLSAVVG